MFQKLTHPVIALCMGLLVFSSACVSSSFTHLTPSVLERAPSNQYTIEMTYKPSTGLRPLTNVRAAAIVNGKSYALQLMDSFEYRWQTLIEAPASLQTISIQYKLVYSRGSDVYGERVQSDLSQYYTLKLRDTFDAATE